MRVLHVEDDHVVAHMVELLLKMEGFALFHTDLGEDAVDLAKTYDYDIILLDLTLPDMSGIDVLRQIRAAKVTAPVLVLTGSTDIGTKVKAYGLGADGFLSKPFHKDELVALIHSIVRRSKGHAASTIEVGEIVIDIDAKTASIAGHGIHLTGKEYAMLELLALRKGITLSKDTFLNHLYGGMDEPELKIIDVFICKLRKKLQAATGKKYISTVWGRGYVLTDGDADVPPCGRVQGVQVPRRRFTGLDLLLLALKEKSRTTRELSNALPHGTGSVIGFIHTAKKAGFVTNNGSRRFARYALTELGRARAEDRLAAA